MFTELILNISATYPEIGPSSAALLICSLAFENAPLLQAKKKEKKQQQKTISPFKTLWSDVT